LKTMVGLALLLFVGLTAAHSRADEAGVCRECHLSKSSPVTEHKAPVLAGQHPQYIVKQLERFATANGDDPYRRANTAMTHALKRPAPGDRLHIARTLSEEECPFHGNENLPVFTPNPCAACHGARGLSGNPEIPNLAGQDARYLFYQYQKLREPYLLDVPGTKANGTPQRLHPVMGPLSARLKDSVVSIMIYYSKLPCR